MAEHSAPSTLDSPHWTLEDTLPTRRIFELIIVGGILMRPAFGVIHLWALKALNTSQEGTIIHGIAEITTVLV